ncbi:hypothetical protein Pmani_017763 [Petrolisthes manimaculis]|uniref:Uncharacterized protein n=1 Tax=Petrolisthes manimaculis TaxID=1843537 RepID=A0AAE1U922_9EUCA|nr:hypothetical protein Pmani_017763 [Petrolisthes manimaculis]
MRRVNQQFSHTSNLPVAASDAKHPNRYIETNTFTALLQQHPLASLRIVTARDGKCGASTPEGHQHYYTDAKVSHLVSNTHMQTP